MSEQIFNFGVGQLFARRTDTAIGNAYHFGTVQEAQVMFERDMVELHGQNAFPADVALGKGKITGQCKFADINARAYNNLFFAQTLTTLSGELIAYAEVHSIPTTPFQVTITPPSSGTYVNDYGVKFVVSGTPLVEVASGPTTGQYSHTAGVYTFAAADTGLQVAISYSYTSALNTQIALSNPLMGFGPTFMFQAQMSYTSANGVTNNLNLRLNACRCGKTGFPFKNIDFTIDDFNFQAFADGAGNIGNITLTQ